MPNPSKASRLPIPPRRLSALAVFALLFPVVCGCVQRRMTIRSNPPGALVYIDDYEIGVTPVSTNFTYYGTRKIRLVRDGYETLTVMENINPTWYQIPPIDFFSDNFVPGEIRDTRTLTYQLQPLTVCPPEELLGRAEQLRNQLYSADGTAVPSTLAPRTTPPDAAPASPTNPPVEPIPSGTPIYPGPYEPGPYDTGTPVYPNTGAPAADASPYPVYPSTDSAGGSAVYPLPPGQ